MWRKVMCMCMLIQREQFQIHMKDRLIQLINKLRKVIYKESKFILRYISHQYMKDKLLEYLHR